MHAATALIAGATLEAARTVWSGEHDHAINIAGGLHHAMTDSAAGFCVYNDLAVGISWLLANGAQRVVYIDVDVHHGDGVERIFWDDPRVMTISLHESGITQFPGTGWPSDTGGAGAEGTAVNCALPAGAGDAQWLRALDAIVPPLLAAFGPDVVISQHGCDGHHADPLGHMNLSIDGQTAMAQRIHQWVHKFTKGKWVVTGGGGYAIVDVVPRAWTQLIAEVCGHGLSTDTELPARWRSETEALTGITAPATAGENVACSTYSWVSDRRAEDATDQAIAQTRQAVFPHFGLDPDSAQ
jgi:acetoin utilization protein AcuC